MPQPLRPQSVRNLGVYGIIREAAVDKSLIPDGAVTESINFHFDRVGATTVRPGIAGLGSTIQHLYSCAGLHNAQSGTLIAVVDGLGSSAIYALDGTTWGLSLGGGTASIRARFVDFGSFTIAVNFIQNTLGSMRFWGAGADGASYWKFSGNPINPQNMWGRNPQYGEVYKSRVYVSGDPAFSSRLFFSSVISTNGNITWTPTTDFVDINPGDGEDNTGLKRYSLELLFFKPNYIYRFRTIGVDPDPLIKVGTRSQESIIEGKRGVYFHHDSGIYRYSGGYPEEISRPIIDVIEAIPFSKYSKISSWNDSDHIHWSLGNLTIEGEIWRNVVVRYTESSEIWTVYSMSNEPLYGSAFNSGSDLTRVVGTDHGVVATFNSGTADLDEPIKFRLITKFYEWEGIAIRKIIQRMVFLCEKAQGMQFMYQTDDNPEWHSLGQFRKFLNYFKKNTKPFHRIRFKATGVVKDEAPIFQGFEILEGINEGFIE